ncbi:MAG: YfhO family protein, partial [Chloroflexi bacterium]|nr:YfhO family protein [Chloroflexota bacterium]
AVFHTGAALFWGELRALPANLVTSAVMLLAGTALAAVQLVPTAELTSWGIRGAGLTYQAATTFSLKGTMLLDALLPPFQNRDFVAQPGGTEFLGYVSVTALVLAVVALAYGFRRKEVWFFAVLAAGALFLALGQQNPLYPALFRFVPGFNLLRVPARWLFVYSFGVSALAGLGTHEVFSAGRKRPQWPLALGVAAFAAAALAILRVQQMPSPVTRLAWVGFGVASLALVVLTTRLDAAGGGSFLQGWREEQAHRLAESAGRLRVGLAVVVLALVAGELWLASGSLDYNHPTLPEVFTQPLSTVDEVKPRVEGWRVLSVAQDTFVPAIESQVGPRYRQMLGQDGLFDYLQAYKLREILEPNTPMAEHIPTIDGYDGGLLPLTRYVDFKDALTGQQAAPDDRIRFVIKWLPNRPLMDLGDVRYLLMDGLADKSDGDVRYDLSGFMRVNPAQTVQQMELLQPAQTASLGVVLAAKVPDGTAPDAIVATLNLDDGAGATQDVPIRLGGREFGKLPWSEPLTTYLTVVPLQSQINAQILTLTAGDAGADVYLNGLAFIRPDGVATSPLVAPGVQLQRLYQGDVKLYQNPTALGPAFLVHRAQLVPSEEAASAAIKAPDFDPSATVVLEANPQPPATSSLVSRIIGRVRRSLPGGGAQPFTIPDAWLQPTSGEAEDGGGALDLSPERMAFQVQSNQDSFLVLTQSYFPGWLATIDGAPAQILGADDLFQSVHLTAGTQTVVFTFAPRSVTIGAVISIAAMMVCGLGAVTLWVTYAGRAGLGRRQRR